MTCRLHFRLPLLVPFFLILAIAGGAEPAQAQTFTLDLGGDGATATGRLIQIFLLMTVLSLAPSILIMVTSFTRIVVVLSFLRTAMGVQQTPPNQVLISLALFLTVFVMMPTFEASWEQGIRPLIEGEIEEAEAFEKSVAPLHQFMRRYVREQDLVPSIFMTVAFIGNDPKACGAFKKNPPGMIYAEMKDAAPRSINGYPMFFSCSFLSQKDTERVFAVYQAMTEALDSIGESK
ncbi:MAG: hypothetical protein IIB38_15605 [Candidatus Hydrogenedentes bacterium]|nr:hypothetical protein [Candidatus Hydrogenedentota bacterium]